MPEKDSRQPLEFELVRAGLVNTIFGTVLVLFAVVSLLLIVVVALGDLMTEEPIAFLGIILVFGVSTFIMLRGGLFHERKVIIAGGFVHVCERRSPSKPWKFKRTDPYSAFSELRVEYRGYHWSDGNKVYLAGGGGIQELFSFRGHTLFGGDLSKAERVANELNIPITYHDTSREMW